MWLKRGVGMDAPLLDVDYLGRLERQLGGGVVAELLSDGVIELTDRLGRLRELVERGDRAGTAALAHDLVAVAGHLGLSALSIAAVDLNRGARVADGPPLAELASPVLALAAPSLDAMAARIEAGAEP